MRILVVEDHADSAEFLRLLLVRGGHSVVIAGTLAEARSHCHPGKFDLLIGDIGLPDGDGWELAALARECGAKAIAVTGYGTAADTARSAASGFFVHLTKPIDFADLDRAIASCA